MYLCRYMRSLLVLSALIAFAMVAHPAAMSQSPAPQGNASVTGDVRDANGLPVPGAQVFLDDEKLGPPLTSLTGPQGWYRFSSLRGGAYTVRVETKASPSSAFGPFVLKSSESKQVDFKLDLRQNTSSASAVKLPGFFDEPKFTVAGVTTPANPGGHGSDEALRTTEALTRATIALEPDSSIRSSSPTRAEQKLRHALHQNSNSFEANYQLGKLLLAENKPADALPYLEKAAQLKPRDYESAYDLAQAYEGAGEQTPALARAKSILSYQDTADVHRLLGQIEEKSGDPIAAVQQYQRAAELDASEANLFAWGAELLQHDTLEPATEVFLEGNRLFPRSVRMLVGLGVAWYSRGSYDQAVRSFCLASDLDPRDPDPYMFLSKIQSGAALSNPEILKRLQRFWRLQPNDAVANYYYALALWQKNREEQSLEIATKVESLLKKAIALNPNLSRAYLQLGIVDASRNDFVAAIENYRKAIALDPSLAEAHFHLSQAYMRAGEQEPARQEGRLYQQMSQEKSEEAARELKEIQQFVYKSQETAAPR